MGLPVSCWNVVSAGSSPESSRRNTGFSRMVCVEEQEPAVIDCARGQRWTVQTCLTCQRSQRFLNDPKHLLWGDRPEAQLGSQADPKPTQPLPNTAQPGPAPLPEEKLPPQSSSHK
ncbi:Ribonuclease P protein subunit p21 [Tupaia chinensis]|uniref:Ribonuclease P protein subunit p21 n=1 Tax=Tupaia chinensis TaxID=246437 RepID=L9JJL9_TUPCH|nr:Ribonuclease P protein subunit p21 [Tupaia chinensis]